jgi:hypothetical protein
MTKSVLARIATLKSMAASELKKQWRELFDTEPPPFNRPYLESRLAYRIQELAYGGLKPYRHRRRADHAPEGRARRRRHRAIGHCRSVAAGQEGGMTRATVSTDSRTVTVHVPWELKKRGGWKLVICPDGTSSIAKPVERVDSAIVKALVRAFRWRKLLETGVYGSAAELAAAEGVDPSYLGRVLRLTLLSPDIVEAILDERLPAWVGLAELLKPFPVEWERQRRRLR